MCSVHRNTDVLIFLRCKEIAEKKTKPKILFGDEKKKHIHIIKQYSLSLSITYIYIHPHIIYTHSHTWALWTEAQLNGKWHIKKRKRKQTKQSTLKEKATQNEIQPIQKTHQTQECVCIHRTKEKETDNRMIIIRKVYVYSRITIKSPLFTQRTVEYINTVEGDRTGERQWHRFTSIT